MKSLTTFLLLLGLLSLGATIISYTLSAPTAPDQPQSAIQGTDPTGQVRVAIAGNSGRVQLTVKE